uniref:Putative secreted protein n=1 Tax=Amblyomma americanum TaxID=6943 RepID=A0A0C9S3H2_AMBAM
MAPFWNPVTPNVLFAFLCLVSLSAFARVIRLEVTFENDKCNFDGHKLSATGALFMQPCTFVTCDLKSRSVIVRGCPATPEDFVGYQINPDNNWPHCCEEYQR